MLRTPCGRCTVVVHLALDDTLQTFVESLLTFVAQGLIYYIFEVSFVIVNVTQYLHDVGHEVIVERYVVLIASASAKRIVL